MERRSKHSKRLDDVEQHLAITKAAAWAWHQRGTSSSASLASKHGLITRTRQANKPSRYKLEAMMIKSEENSTKESTSKSTTTSSCQDDDKDNSHLLDRYEMERIARHIDDYMVATYETSNGFIGGETSGMKSSKKTRGKKIKKWSWLKHGVAVCGSRDDDIVNPIRLA